MALKKDVVIVSACFMLLWVACGTQIVPTERDFYNFHRGASMALEGRFVEVNVRSDARIIFVRPPFYALLLAPLALIPTAIGEWVWMGLQALVFCGCIWWACRRFGTNAMLFGAVYAPAALAIPHGQDASFLLAIVTAAYALAEREKPAAGAVLALGLIKFHLFLLWPLLLLISRRFRMLAWYSGTALILGAISLLLAGISGLHNYLDLLRRKDLVHLLPSIEKNVDLQGILANFQIDSTAIYAAAVVLVIAAAIVAAIGAPWWKLFAIASAGSLLVGPHVYVYDAALLLLPAWCAIFLSKSRFTRTAAAIVLMPVLVLAGILGPPLSALFGLTVLGFFAACVIEKKSATPAPRRPPAAASVS